MNYETEKGLIVIGYPGIGKSTYAKNYGLPNLPIIDLESSTFAINDVKPDKWYKMYCQIAVYLARRHYIVFISSHKEVVEELKLYSYINDNYDVVILCPHISLETDWINKLQKRFLS